MRMYLSQSLSIGAHVSENNQDVFLTLVRQELRRSQGQTRSDDTLNATGRARERKEIVHVHPYAKKVKKYCTFGTK